MSQQDVHFLSLLEFTTLNTQTPLFNKFRVLNSSSPNTLPCLQNLNYEGLAYPLQYLVFCKIPNGFFCHFCPRQYLCLLQLLRFSPAFHTSKKLPKKHTFSFSQFQQHLSIQFLHTMLCIRPSCFN